MMYVVLWSIWKVRNRIIFESYPPNWDFEIQQLKIRLVIGQRLGAMILHSPQMWLLKIFLQSGIGIAHQGVDLISYVGVRIPVGDFLINNDVSFYYRCLYFSIWFTLI